MVDASRGLPRHESNEREVYNGYDDDAGCDHVRDLSLAEYLWTYVYLGTGHKECRGHSRIVHRSDGEPLHDAPRDCHENIALVKGEPQRGHRCADGDCYRGHYQPVIVAETTTAYRAHA